MLCKEAKTKTRKKNKDDIIADSLFWPVMHRLDLSLRYDLDMGYSNTGGAAAQVPHVVQPYHVPIPSFAPGACTDTDPEGGNLVPALVRSTYTGNNTEGTGFGVYHDRCLYSVWMHFVDYCMTLSTHAPTPTPTPGVPASPLNKYLGTRRLPIFIRMALGDSDPRER